MDIRKRRAIQSLGVVLALTVVLAAAPASANKQPGARNLAANAGDGKVKLSGWATFSGQVIGHANDPEDDGVLQAQETGAEIIESTFVYRPENEDFFWRLEVTKIPTAGPGLDPVGPGDPSTLYGLQFSANNINYEIRAHKLGTVDPAAPAQPGFGLFTCDENLCTEVATLKGGYGSAGESIIVSVPLNTFKDDDAPVREGDKIGGLVAYTGIGQYLTGVAGGQFRDQARLLSGDQADVEIPVKSVHVTVKRVTKLARLKDGFFHVSLSASFFRNSPTTVKTKTCLGRDCATQSFKVKT